MEMAAFVVEALQQPVPPKATLGKLVEAVTVASRDKAALTSLATALNAANKVWQKIKHRNDPNSKDIRVGLEALKRVFQVLEQLA